MNETATQPLTPDYEGRGVPIPERQPERSAPLDNLSSGPEQKSELTEVEKLRAERDALQARLTRLLDKRQNQRDQALIDAQVRLLEVRSYLLKHRPKLWQQFIESHPWFS